MEKSITSEHLNWWENLPELWKKIFHCAIYYPETVKLDDENNDEYTDYSEFILKTNKTELKSPNDLLKLFEIKELVFNRFPNPPLETALHQIVPMHYFKQLEVLSLTENYIKDLSGLVGLNKLKYLSLHENIMNEKHNSQLKYIAQLPNLQYLDLSINWFSDYSPLSQLKQLKRLSLWWCSPYNRESGRDDAIDVSFLADLVQLEELNLSCNTIQSLEPLTKLTNLRELDLGSDEQIWDKQTRIWLENKLPNCEINW